MLEIQMDFHWFFIGQKKTTSNFTLITETSSKVYCYGYILKYAIMAIPKNPEDNVPLDDAVNSEAEDQQSQKDLHSNGFDENFDKSSAVELPEVDLLKQAFDASESSYTLDVDKGIAPKKGSNEKKS